MLWINSLVCRVKKFIRNNGGEIQDDFESFNGFSWVLDAELMAAALKVLLIYSAKISEDVVTDLRSHEYVEDVEYDVFANAMSSSDEEMAAPPVLNNARSLEPKRLLRHLSLETKGGGQPSRAAHAVPSLFFIESAPPSTRGARCRLPSCARTIQPGTLRLAMHPGMEQDGWGRRGACTQSFLLNSQRWISNT